MVNGKKCDTRFDFLWKDNVNQRVERFISLKIASLGISFVYVFFFFAWVEVF